MKKFLCVLAVIVIAIIGIVTVSRVHSVRTNNRALVAYFSATGNTAAVADRLANAIGANVFAIVPADIYIAEDLNWKNDKSRSSMEMADRSSRPAITNTIDNIEQYDVIFVGFPIWWGREPSVVDTFLESHDFNGKTIVLFATSGSTPTTADAAENIRPIVPNATVVDGARFPVDVTADELKTWAGEWL